MASRIAALFVDEKGCYSGLPDVDVWGVSRDARLYRGDLPVVAHPPCARWCKLAPVNEARYGQRVGDDGGCFEAALRAVRTFGGVLEHPALSIAWERFKLPFPSAFGWRRDFIDGGWVCEVSQRAYGHAARKATWLYYVGDVSPPALDWSSPPPGATVSYLTNRWTGDLPRLSPKKASATPPTFRDLLLSIARSARVQEVAA